MFIVELYIKPLSLELRQQVIPLSARVFSLFSSLFVTFATCSESQAAFSHTCTAALHWSRYYPLRGRCCLQACWWGPWGYVRNKTLLREWYDERLAAWVYYFRVSWSMNELPELVSFLLTTDAGQKAVRTVVDESRLWSRQALRTADIAVYVYQLMLELTRLQDLRRVVRQA